MTLHRFVLFSVFFSILVLLPYGLAFLESSDEVVFQGLLFNPADGNSYLAKMYQGWQGSWHFKLPYTAEPGDGAYLFLYYLFLGHLARWTGLSLILVYHLARWLGALFLLWALRKFFISLDFSEKTTSRAFVLTALGAGMGWLVFLFGQFTADFWVAEAYPFLSAYANPHFPLGLGLMLFLLAAPITQKAGQAPVLGVQTALQAIAAFWLAVLSPFGVVIVFLVTAGRLAWQAVRFYALRSRQATDMPRFIQLLRNPVFQPEWKMLLVLLAAGFPLLFYDLIVANCHPVLAVWNAQNLTPSPPVWDVLLSFSPAIFLAVVGVISRLRKTAWQADTLIIWLLTCLILMYFPWGLQRRFMLGLYVPTASLAVVGLDYLAERTRLAAKPLFILLLVVSVISPLIVISSGLYVAKQKDGRLFLSTGEAECLSWLEVHSSPDALVLASPQMGLYIPARTGRRVLYGHPFETAHAEKEEQVVLQLLGQKAAFEQAQAASQYLQQRGVDYLFWGEREAAIGAFPAWVGLTEVCRSGEASLFRFEPE